MYLLGYISKVLLRYFLGVVLIINNVNGIMYFPCHLVKNKKYPSFASVCVLTSPLVVD